MRCDHLGIKEHLPEIVREGVLFIAMQLFISSIRRHFAVAFHEGCYVLGFRGFVDCEAVEAHRIEASKRDGFSNRFDLYAGYFALFMETSL